MKTDNEQFEKDLIDVFMGRTMSRINPHQKIPSYSNSWDMLMPVVEKIKQIYNNEEDRFRKGYIFNKNSIFKTGIMMPIDDVYQKVVSFIKWYNSTKQ